MQHFGGIAVQRVPSQSSFHALKLTRHRTVNVAADTHAVDGGGLVFDLGQRYFICQADHLVVPGVGIVVINNLGDEVARNIQAHRSYPPITDSGQ